MLRLQSKWAPRRGAVIAVHNQELAINYAADYELGAIAQLGERVTGSHEVGGSNPPSSTPRPLV